MGNREIKFRVWNGLTNTMIDLKKITPFALNMDTDGLFIPYCGMPLMQYTGLKDSKGQEIYEGDIINFKKDSSYFYGATGAIVEYQDGGFYPFADAEDNMPYPKPEECEVIGNVFQNPELM